MFDDTGRNIPETRPTLLLQQCQLVYGLRPAQMFPVGTEELPLPHGFERIETGRGVFHYNPDQLSRERIARLSADRRENEILALGPYNKDDVIARMDGGEDLVVISELSPNGTEVKAAAGTPATAGEQRRIFEATKLPNSVIHTETIMGALSRRMEGS